MNDEILEQELRNLPAPELPAKWQTEILSTAMGKAQTSLSARQVWPPLLGYLQNLLRRNPVTASALAMFWILIFVFKTTTPINPSEKILLAHIDPNRPIYPTSIFQEIQFAQFLQDQPDQRQMP